MLAIVVVAAVAGGAGALTAMLWPDSGSSEGAKDDPTQAEASAMGDAPSPTASAPASDGAVDLLTGPSPLAIDGEILPAGIPVEANPVDFFGDVHPMALTIEGVSQRDDCTVVLLRVIPTGPLDSFTVPNVGIVSDGLLYDGGGCETTGLEDAGYLSSFDVSAGAGETVTYYDFAQIPGGSLADVDAVAVEIGEGEYLYFEPTEKTLP